ncbi:mechanosensitive ion channel family protein [Rhizobiaceae bacterium n13]|uniref:Mechanosensitive ion channel family protein n=1 Tax=Ferirhizobium litorale TaxID=2927786 RepID=A0AAE3U3J9_9HYPH|nr:mechanosensitive ion channel family protein [Fererhizobium litorale]MDI7865319.1 mechanosensitive ion channel family protein [Fererhizobium litorale]MDI7925224.1 mechanosensitive ion channel family protein [Fererhizobium litorale]
MFQGTPLLPVVLNVLGIAGILVWKLQGRSRPMARLVVQIVFFAAMTGVLVLARISPFQFDPPNLESRNMLVVSSKILWWVHLSWALIGFIRIYIVLEGRPREERLVQDLVVTVVYLGVALSVLTFVFDFPIKTLLATSGVAAIILGLALQNTLSDVFSGIALTLGRPYVIGDWISLSDGTSGRVIASNWRSTYLLTATHNVVVIPNSILAKLGITNASRPDESHEITMPIRIAPTHVPRLVVEVMNAVLESCNMIVKDPAPNVALMGIDASAIEVELWFRVTSPAQRRPARNEVIDLVYRHCKANGLRLAMPPTALIAAGDPSAQRGAASATASQQGLIDAVPVFSVLTQDERNLLAASAAMRTFPPGKEIAAEGASLGSLMIIKTGIVAMMSGDAELARFAPGDYFGERGFLTGTGETHALRAVTRVTLSEIDKATFARLLKERPELAEDLAAHLADREGPTGAPDNPVTQGARRRSDVLKAIRSMFGLR